VDCSCETLQLVCRVFFLEISTEAVLERQTLKATDPYSGNQYHLLYNPPTTEQVTMQSK